MPPIAELRRLFGDRLQEAAPLARLTSSRTGGSAEALVEARSAQELRQAAVGLWQLGISFRMLGSGSNVLVADSGVHEVVVLNQASRTRLEVDGMTATAWAEAGASLGGLARLAGDRGLSGLEWAATVPGTVGGAVVGNAGAHGGDVARCLETAEILQPPDQVENWTVERLEYGYRSSWLKRHPGEAVVLSAVFGLEPSSPEITRARMEANLAHRRQTQPPGASWGSMFKNPPGDFAGRLIEAAGLKGWRVGQVEVSPIHANFFINHGGATAADVASLLIEVRRRVREHTGVQLDLEIELLGEWPSEVREALS